jgi:NifU-like protein involved in Fe-S cluster formation
MMCGDHIEITLRLDSSFNADDGRSDGKGSSISHASTDLLNKTIWCLK